MKEYTIDVGGLKHTFLMSAEEAERRGAVEVKQAQAVPNKAHKPRNKQG